MALADADIGHVGRSPVARCLGQVDCRSQAIASVVTRLRGGLDSSTPPNDVR
jgi:hypothetical protein